MPDPHTDDRRHAVLSQDSHSLFRVRVVTKIPFQNYFQISKTVPDYNSVFIPCSTLSTLRECLSIAIMKSHPTPFLRLVTRGMTHLTCCTLNRNNAETTDRNNAALSVSSRCSCSHKLLRSPRKPARKISKIPFKVLDAPELQDDFYLNLVDWSAGNLLSVGLGACVYLWSACTSQVRAGPSQLTE